MINFEGQKKAAKPSMTVQEFFNSLGKPGQVSDYDWFVNDVQVQLTANQKVTTCVKLNSNLRIESIQKQQQFNPVPVFNITPPINNMSIGPPQVSNINPPGVGNITLKIGPPQQQLFQQQQSTGFNIVPPGTNGPIMKPIISSAIKRKDLPKSGNKEINLEIRDFQLQILDYGDKVTLTKKDDSFQASLFETDSTPEITKNIQSALRPNDLCQDDTCIGRLNETKVMFFRDFKGIVIRWRTSMVSKLEFWLEDD